MRLLIIIYSILFTLNAYAASDEKRPYSDESPWNQKIEENAQLHPQNEIFINELSNSGYFGSNVSSWTMPLYIVNDQTNLVDVYVSGWFSDVKDNDQKLDKLRRVSVRIPIPEGAKPAKGSDSQIILWNPVTGDEWGFWQARQLGDKWVAVNGYHYNTNWDGVPPSGFISRGAGVPYFVGLIRPWEIRQGRIDHAIAFATNLPSTSFVYPATKTDGKGQEPRMSMGSRIQLNPSLTDIDFDKWGLSKTGKIIAKAMQEYGLYIIDGSGHPKIYGEYEGTASWQGLLKDKTVTPIPYQQLRVLSNNQKDKLIND